MIMQDYKNTKQAEDAGVIEGLCFVALFLFIVAGVPMIGYIYGN